MLTNLLKPASRGPRVNPPKRQSGNAVLANAAVQAWAGHMKRMCESEPFGRAMGIPTDMIGQVVTEISRAAQRTRISEQMTAQLDRVLFIAENNDAIVAKATLIAAKVLNSFVSTLGYDKKPVEQRPSAPNLENAEGPIFAVKPVVHDASGIGEKRTHFADNYAVDWCAAFHASLRDNALSLDGSIQDPVQNAKLGEIVSRLGP
jgi:hypothetical protein